MSTGTATAVASPPASSDPLRFAVGARARDTQTFYDETRALGAAAVFPPEAKVPVGDWLETIYIVVDVTGDNAGAAVVALQADAPWSIFSEVSFLDAAGNTVQALSGFNFYLQNAFGGQNAFQDDPLASTFYNALSTGNGATAGSGRFILQVPVEIINRELLGAYPNGASNAAVRVKFTLAPLASVFSTAPSASTNVRIRMISRGAVLPSSSSPTGRPYMKEPMGPGTFQQWSQIPYDVTAGRRVIAHARKGNVYRELIFVTRNASGARVGTLVTNFKFSVDDVPSPPAGPWDYCRHVTWQRGTIAAANVPTGVIVVDFCSEWDGKRGAELRDNWILTAPGSKVEMELDVAATGTVEVITNEIVPRGTGVLRV